MSVALADVNVLIALFDPDHIHHEDAHRWLRSLGRMKWATCPLASNGCMRILSQSSYTGNPLTPLEVATVLHSLLDQPNHEFWPDSISILDETLFDLKHIESGKHLTDVYLLGLAVRREGHLVTFDRSIPWKAVVGAKASHLKVLGGPSTR